MATNTKRLGSGVNGLVTLTIALWLSGCGSDSARADLNEVTISSIQWSAVAGTSSSDVWIAGFGNELYHYDGVEWEPVEEAVFSSGRVDSPWPPTTSRGLPSSAA